MTPLIRHLTAVLILGALHTPRAHAGDLPRYDLQVGQKITWTTEKVTEMAIQTMGSTGTWTAWVVDSNPDGTWTVVARADSHRYTIRDGVRKEMSDHVWLAQFDLRPDGRYIHNPTLGFSFDPSGIFVPLATSEAEQSDGWTVNDEHFMVRRQFSVDPDAPVQDARLRIRGEAVGATDGIYLVERKATIDFDRDRGVVERIERTTSQEWSSRSTSVATVQLVGIEQVDPDGARTLGEEAEAFFALQRRYDERGAEAERHLRSLEDAMEEARAEVERELERFTVPELREKIEKILEDHERKIRYRRTRATRFAGVLDKPAPDWTLEDLDGNTHALASHRGKVVILDFWYRACGWCLRAMPQVIRLANDLADEPVAVFGMNTDRDLEDARFVTERIEMPYPSLQAAAIPGDYHVQAFPTLIIVDREGVVRDVHVGYTPDLYEKVLAEVRRLLSEP